MESLREFAIMWFGRDVRRLFLLSVRRQERQQLSDFREYTKMTIIQLTDQDLKKITELRHDLHMHPELSGREFRTTEKIREFLAALPGCLLLDLPVPTGVAAQIPGNSAEEIMLRADIDALPQTEQVDIPWKSLTPGCMHACGHDLHTAALCGAALLLEKARQQGQLTCTVDLVYQPAEEGTTGARNLINAGLFEQIHPKACFGLHNWPSVDTGKVVCRQGALMAAKRNFEIILYGAGGHGSMPHLNTDPIVCAAAVIQSLQTIVSRNINPLDSAVLSINLIRGGSPVNRVADEVEFMGTIRSLSDKALDKAITRAEEIVQNTAAAYGCRSEVKWKERIPAVWNSPEMTAEAVRIAQATGCTLTDAPPSLASEDFALYREYAPSFFYWVGSRAPGTAVRELHTPDFFADDSALKTAAELLAACALVTDVCEPVKKK